VWKNILRKEINTVSWPTQKWCVEITRSKKDVVEMRSFDYKYVLMKAGKPTPTLSSIPMFGLYNLEQNFTEF
jgi:hypothetical protein